MAITASRVKELRETTGAGMMDAKSLTEQMEILKLQLVGLEQRIG